MDFLDPRKERLNRIVLFVSYGLVSLAIAIASVVLLSVTDGYCVDGKGEVDKCGFVFVSTQPSGATITVDGKPKKERTNTKLNFRSGVYTIRLSRDGYRDWEHQVMVLGGDVQRFDYPFLFPKTLTSSPLATFSSTLSYLTQSPNRRWVVLADSAQPPEQVYVYDLGNALKPVASTLNIPSGIVTPSTAAHTWKVLEWSDDNRHVLLQHVFTTAESAGLEYIMLDRQNVAGSRNISRELGLGAADQLSLFNKKPTQFYAYNPETKILRTVALNGAAPSAVPLQHVLAYKTSGDNTVLYATDTPPSGKVIPGQVSIVLQQDNRVRVIRRLPASASAYLLDIARYSSNWYVVVGSDVQKGAHIYRNPFDGWSPTVTALPAPIRFLKLAQPTYVAFSSTSQFMAVENGQQFAIYDAERDQAAAFQASQPLDKPQTHAQWMDGNRLLYVSGGQLVVFDYDNLNPQTLQAALPDWAVCFSPDFRSVITTKSSGAGTQLMNTPLILP